MRILAQRYWDYVFLLNLFSCTAEPLDNLKVQKVTFISEDLARQQKIKAAHFPFFRYNLGPYSKELAKDVRKLEDLGFVHPETRQPTERGKYLLNYVQDFLKASRAAQRSLQVLHEVCEKYRNVKSSKLVDIVYKMKVSVAQFNDQIMLVRDIPQFAGILCPDSDGLEDFSVFPRQALEDLGAEFTTSADDLREDNPENIAVARSALDAALTR